MIRIFMSRFDGMKTSSERRNYVTDQMTKLDEMRQQREVEQIEALVNHYESMILCWTGANESDDMTFICNETLRIPIIDIIPYEKYAEWKGVLEGNGYTVTIDDYALIISDTIE